MKTEEEYQAAQRQYADFLKSMTEGDKVAIRRDGYPSWEILTVAKITPTQGVLNDGRRFWRMTGRMHSSQRQVERVDGKVETEMKQARIAYWSNYLACDDLRKLSPENQRLAFEYVTKLLSGQGDNKHIEKEH